MNCASCGNPIPAERLEAVPDTKHCMSCQRQVERMTGKPLVDEVEQLLYAVRISHAPGV